MTMKVSKRDLTILLIAAGVIIAFCVYQFYFRKAVDEKKTLEQENDTLQARVNELYGFDDQSVVKEMGDRSKELKTAAKNYPARYRYEDLIVYLDEWEILPYDEIYTEMYNFPRYSLTETDYDVNLSGVLDWDDDAKAAISTSYWFGQATIDTTYRTNSYKAFKDMINKIYLNGSPKTIQSVTASMNKTNGFVSGTMVVNFQNVQFSQEGESNVYQPVEVTNVPTSVENIFGPTYTPTPTVTPTPKPNQKAAEE